MVGYCEVEVPQLTDCPSSGQEHFVFLSGRTRITPMLLLARQKQKDYKTRPPPSEVIQFRSKNLKDRRDELALSCSREEQATFKLDA